MRSTLVVFLLIASQLSAAIFHSIDTTQPLSCRFSLQQHNRILIENGRIKKIIFPEEKLHVRMEETSGQVFIQAKTLLQEKIVVSIVSQSGVVQDVEIEFVEQPSQVIVLLEIADTQQQMCCTPGFSQEDPHSIVEAILQEKIPLGFLSAPITNSCKTIRHGIKAKLIGHLQGAYEDLYIYQIQNTRMWKKRLLEHNLACSGAVWVYLQKNCLEPKEIILAIVAVQT